MNRTVYHEDELRTIRQDIAAGRRPGSYIAEQWSVSPVNRTVGGGMPPSVVLRDTTLRGIGSVPGRRVTDAERLELLRALLDAGLSQLVTANPGGRDPAVVREEIAAATESSCEIVCPFVDTPQAADSAADLGYATVQVPVPGFGPASILYDGSVYQAAWRGEPGRPRVHRSRAEWVADSLEVIRHCRSLGLGVIAPMMMISYLTQDELAGTATELAAAGSQEITLFDGPGAVGPEALATMVTALRTTAPAVTAGVHPHNTFGLAVGCAASAVRAGAGVIEVSVNGYCGGPGNADLATTAVALEALYGVSTGVRLAEMTDLARRAESLTGIARGSTQPMTGPLAFCWGGADWLVQEEYVDPLLHNCIEPALVGNERYVPITAASGPYAVLRALDSAGVAVADPQTITVILQRCHELVAERGSPLGQQEVSRIARQILDDE